MKKVIAFCVLMLAAATLMAVENDQVMYVGGTVPSLKQGSVGQLNLTSETILTFEAGSSKLDIPYSRIESFQYSREVAHHLGVLPAIAVGLVKRRERKHFFRISYRDEANNSQAAIFEVSKKMPAVVQAALQTRVPRKSCPGTNSTPCRSTLEANTGN
jgi:hypothetical protein